MTAGGWALLAVSWITLSVLFLYCIRRALRDSETEGSPPPDDPTLP